MDWTTIITSILTLAMGGGLGTLITLKTTRKRAEFELLNDQLTKEMERNKELIQINIDKEDRFQKQTDRLRECQDRELQLNKQILELTQAVAQRDVEMVKVRCEDSLCPWRRPPNALTPPPPEVDKDEWIKAVRESENPSESQAQSQAQA